MALLSEWVHLRTLKDTSCRELVETTSNAVWQDKGKCGRNEHGRGRDYERGRACIFTKLSLMTLHNFFLVSLTRTGIDLDGVLGGLHITNGVFFFFHHVTAYRVCIILISISFLRNTRLWTGC